VSETVELLAKSIGTTLKEHTNDVLNVVKKLKESGIYKPPGEDDWKTLEVAARYHDTGKAFPGFQLKILSDPEKMEKLKRELGVDEGEKLSDLKNIPHSFLSIVFIPKKHFQSRSENDFSDMILLSAVAFHHWRDTFSYYLLGQDKEKLQKAFQLLCKYKDKILTLLKNSIDDIEFNEELCDYLSRESLAESGLIFPPQVMMFLPSFMQSELFIAEKLPGQLEKESERHRKRCLTLYRKYIFVKGMMLRADRFASMVEGSKEQALLDEVEIKWDGDTFSLLVDILENKKGYKLWQKKILEKARGSNIILISPTGSGKTEFALMWSKGKTLFTLPIRSAVNSIWKRLVEYIESSSIMDEGKYTANNFKYVRLLYSGADIFIYQMLDADPDRESEVWKLQETARHLSTHFVVSTGDQIFPAAVKYPGYEMIYSVLMGSYLVVDEVQSYNPEAAAVIVKLLEDVSKLGGKFLLMTATLPNFIRSEIEKRANVEKVIDVYSNETPNKPDLKEPRTKVKVLEAKSIMDIVNLTMENFKKGKNVLIIRNTVGKAVETYKILREELEKEKLLLIHSRMTFQDRKRIENELEKFAPGEKNEEKAVLVSTQVVEASLNIDFDVLITDIAPADALVQRMGRVYRKRKYERNDPNVYILITRDKNGKIDYSKGVYERALILLTLAELLGIEIPEKIKNIEEKLKSIPNKEFYVNENQKKELVEKVYEHLANTNTDYMRKFRETLEILDSGYVAENKNEAQRIFRLIASIDVIPGNLAEKLVEEIKEGEIKYFDLKIKVITKYLVSIPYRSTNQTGSKRFIDYLEENLNAEEYGKIKKDSRLLRFFESLLIAEGVRYERGIGAIFN